MNVAFAHLDKRTSRMEGNISDRHKKSHFDERWHHIGQGTQLAEQAFLNDSALRNEVSVVVDMMGAIVTIGRSSFFRPRMVVEGDGKQHWHVNQQQQPCKLLSSIVDTSH